MPAYIRPRIPGATIFFTVALRARGEDTLVREVDRLRAAVRITRAERPFHIDAWVVLPDHLHAVWTLPEGDADYSVRWGAIKARFSRSVRRAGFTPPSPRPVGRGGVNPALRKGEAGLWQRRFWEHHVRSAEDRAALIRYCHINPVKHGVAETPEAWPYSSVHRERRAGRWP